MSLLNWLTLVGGAVLLVAGVAQVARHIAARRRSVVVSGIVAELRHTYGTHGSGRYYPVLEFTTQEGVEVRATSRMGSNPPPAQPGTRVTVGYDPHSPEEAEIVRRRGSFLAVLLVVPVLGALLLASGVGALFCTVSSC